jgi:uncharacterized membrane protein
MTAVTVVALAARALMAGLFFGFSTFTKGGLRLIPPRDGLVAMQGINRAAPRSAPFMSVFLGGALLALGLGVIAATRIDEPDAPYLLVGSILNVVGVLVTAGFHVPRNDALAVIEPGAADAEQAWAKYARTWTRGNHVRTLTYLASTVAFALALAEV